MKTLNCHECRELLPAYVVANSSLRRAGWLPRIWISVMRATVCASHSVPLRVR